MSTDAPTVSVLIPSRNERFLTETIQDILNKATGHIEVIAYVDEQRPEKIIEDPRLTYIFGDRPRGMRAGTNACAAKARGKYFLKTDAHCMFADGFDEVLAADCEDSWIVIPRRYSLDPIEWKIKDTGKGPIDYHYLSCPIWSIRERHDYSMHGIEWRERIRERRNKPQYDLDEQMSFQGSCWFMTATHFRDHLKGMHEKGYGTFSQEPQEIGNKTWLGPWDGRIMVNKKTWYAHLHKGKEFGRMYHMSGRELKRGHEYAGIYWMNNMWEERARDLEWLIDRFWPVPTWPENWKEIHAKDIYHHGFPK